MNRTTGGQPNTGEAPHVPGSGDTRLAHVSIAASGHHPQDRFETWLDRNRPSFSVSALYGDGGNSALEASGVAFGAASTVFVDFSACTEGSSRYAVRIGPAVPDCVVVRVVRRGAALGYVDGTPVSFRTGDIHIFDGGRDVIDVSGHLTHTSIYIPHSALGRSALPGCAHLVFSTQEPVGRLIDCAVTSAVSQIPRSSLSESARLTEGFNGMVGALVFGDDTSAAASHGAESQRARVMRDYLAENLERPDLGVDMLCQTFAASRATVYRLFASVGGVSRYVKRTRLERAYQDLAKGPAGRGQILAVALRYGFSDASSFSRAFRSEFGRTPTEVVSNSATRNRSVPVDQIPDPTERMKLPTPDRLCPL